MDFNLNEKQLDSLMKMAQKKSGLDVGEMKQAASTGNINDFISKNLDHDGAEKLKKVLSDKQATQNLLNTPEAKSILKKLLEGK